MSTQLPNRLYIPDFCTRFNVTDGSVLTISCDVGSNVLSDILFNTRDTPQFPNQTINNSSRQDWSFVAPTLLYISPRMTDFSPQTPTEADGYIQRDLSGIVVVDNGDRQINNTLTKNASTRKVVPDVTMDDVVARPTTAVRMSHTYTQYRQIYDRRTQDVPWQVLNDLISGYKPINGYLPLDSGTLPSTNATQLLYMQIARDMDETYLLLRGPTNEYLHMLPLSSINSKYIADGTTMLAAWRSDRTSAATTAHWIPYSFQDADGTQKVILQNRASALCLCLETTHTIPYILTENNYSSASRRNEYYPPLGPGVDKTTLNNTIYQINTFFHMVAQGACRMIGISLNAARATKNAQFTVKRSEDIPNNIGRNPIGKSVLDSAIANPNGLYNGITMSKVLSNFCSLGINGLGDACISFAISKPDLVAGWVPTICSKYPNDKRLCGCQNLQQYYGIIQYISVATGYRTTWLAPCNAVDCATASTAWRPVTSNLTCESNTCIQAVIVGKATNVNIEDVSFSCTNQTASTKATFGLAQVRHSTFTMTIATYVFFIGVFLFIMWLFAAFS